MGRDHLKASKEVIALEVQEIGSEMISERRAYKSLTETAKV